MWPPEIWFQGIVVTGRYFSHFSSDYHHTPRLHSGCCCCLLPGLVKSLPVSTALPSEEIVTWSLSSVWTCQVAASSQVDSCFPVLVSNIHTDKCVDTFKNAGNSQGSTPISWTSYMEPQRMLHSLKWTAEWLPSCRWSGSVSPQLS